MLAYRCVVLSSYVCDPGYVEHVIWKKKSAMRTADSGDDTRAHSCVGANKTHTVLIEQPPYEYERVFQGAAVTNHRCNMICLVNCSLSVAALCVHINLCQIWRSWRFMPLLTAYLCLFVFRLSCYIDFTPQCLYLLVRTSATPCDRSLRVKPITCFWLK